MTATLAPFVGAPVRDVPSGELADEPIVGLPASPHRAQFRSDVHAGYSGLRALASRIADVADAVSAFAVASGVETDVRNAHAVICHRLLSMGITAKDAGAKLPRRLSEESVRNRASLGEAIVRHLASEGEADVIAKGINRPHQRAIVRERLAADECNIPQLCAWILANVKAPAKSGDEPQASDDKGESAPQASAPADPSAWYAELASRIEAVTAGIASGEFDVNSDDIVALVIAASDLVNASDRASTPAAA